ncbi:hypothetical protein [Brevundimonas sp. GN22]
MMTKDRFEYLLDAYGADFARWPADARDAGRAALHSDPQLQVAWAKAAALDDMIRLPNLVPSAALRDQIIASATKAGLRARRIRRALLAVWSGAGVAATAVAGAALGIIIAHQLSAPMRADTVFYQASLQGADDTDLLGVEMASLDVKR